MSMFKLSIPTVTMAVPGTSVCLTVDSKTLEVLAVFGVMTFILAGGYLHLINGEQFYTFAGVIIGYIATKIFGITEA